MVQLDADTERIQARGSAGFRLPSSPPLMNTSVLKSNKHRHGQALLAMSVFVFFGEAGVVKTSFSGFCQVKSRQSREWTGMDLHKRAKFGIICISGIEKGYHNGKGQVQRRNEVANRSRACKSMLAEKRHRRLHERTGMPV